MILQLSTLKCVELCLQVIQHGEVDGPRGELIQSLAACGAHCVACAQGEALGGCLPETVQACHDACGVSLLILEKWMVGERSDDNLLLACQAALRTCRAECESAT